MTRSAFAAGTANLQPARRGSLAIHPRACTGLTDDIADASRRLALEVRRAYRVQTGVPYASYIGTGGLDARDDLGGLNLSDVPAVFLESGNMRNAKDAALLRSAPFRTRAARAIVAGVSRFLEQSEVIRPGSSR